MLVIDEAVPVSIRHLALELACEHVSIADRLDEDLGTHLLANMAPIIKLFMTVLVLRPSHRDIAVRSDWAVGWSEDDVTFRCDHVPMVNLLVMSRSRTLVQSVWLQFVSVKLCSGVYTYSWICGYFQCFCCIVLDIFDWDDRVIAAGFWVKTLLIFIFLR